MDYRGAYRELALAVLDYGMVVDSSYFGCAKRFSRSTVVIIINPSLTWRNKLFVLAHEIGHYFRLKQSGLEFLVPSKRVAGEALANRRAVKLLDLVLDEDLSSSYFEFYKKVRRLPKPETWNF